MAGRSWKAGGLIPLLFGVGLGFIVLGCSGTTESDAESGKQQLDAAAIDALDSASDTGAFSDVLDEWLLDAPSEGLPDAPPDTPPDTPPEPLPECGNGVCAPTEDCISCPQDCGPCSPTCPNGVCDSGETCSNCPQDCGPCSEADILSKCSSDPMQWWKGEGKRDITFVGFGDPHASDPSPGCPVNKEEAPNQNKLIRDAINSVGAHTWPKGGNFAKEGSAYDHLRGVIIAGDLTQAGSESVPAGQKICRQYTAYRDVFGRCGTENKLSFPVYDLYGNHDFPRASMPGIKTLHPVIDYLDLITKAHRPGKASDLYDDEVSGTGHYAWRWDDIWFVNVNVKPGWIVEEKINDTGTNIRFVNPFNSRRFLRDFLLSRSNSTKRQIVITGHYGLGSLDEEEKESFCKLIHNAQNGTGNFEGIGKKLSANWPVLAYLHGHNHSQPLQKNWNCPKPYDNITIPMFSLGTPFYNGPHNVAGQLHFTILRIGPNNLEAVGVSAPANNPTGAWSYLYKVRLNHPNQP